MKIVIGQTEAGKPFALPPDVVTSTLVVYGGKGMGKTNLGGVIVEELARVGLRWSVLDPMGVWWGMRHSKDGKSPGVKCLILGGPHGDIPIEPTGGSVVGDLVADEDANVIIDFSRKQNGESWGVGEKIRFVTDYGKRLFQRQSSTVAGRRREPIFQVIDEAARYIPQMIRAGQPELAMCLSVWAQITEEARNCGIGVGFLTQRSARLNKDVAEIADAMFAFRTIGPNSVDAVMDWLGEHVPKDQVRRHVERLRSLARGSCLVVSPGWLQFEGIVDVRERQTFDSSATPKPGESRRQLTGEAAKPDLAKYAERMRETIERAKESDPRELKKRIAELQKEVAKKQAEKSVAAAREPISKKELTSVVQAALDVRDQEWMRSVEGYRRSVEKTVEEAALKFSGALHGVKFDVPRRKTLNLPEAGLVMAPVGNSSRRVVPYPPEQTAAAAAPRHGSIPAPPQVLPRLSVAPRPPADNGELKNAHIRVLSRLVELVNFTGARAVAKERLAAWSGYSPTGGGYANLLGKLRVAGLIDYESGAVVITDAGRELAQPEDVPVSNEEMLARAKKILKGSESRILEAAAQVYPEEISKVDLAERTGFSHEGGGYGNYLGHMRTLGFIDYTRQGYVRAADWLFMEAA